MNIPVTPYFFEKLTIYERVRKGDRLTTERMTWTGEEILLKWSVRNHEHLYSSLRIDAAIAEIKERSLDRQSTLPELKKNQREIEYISPFDLDTLYSELHIRKVFGNLSQHGLAEITEKDGKDEPEKVRFTEKGRMWGDVLMDIEEGKAWKYAIPLSCIKWTAFWFIISLFLKSIYEISLIVYKILSGLNLL